MDTSLIAVRLRVASDNGLSEIAGASCAPVLEIDALDAGRFKARALSQAGT